MPLPPLTTNLMPMGRNAAANQGAGTSILPPMPPGAPAQAPQAPPTPDLGGMGAPPQMAPQAAPAPSFEAIAQADGSSIIMYGGQVVAFNKAPQLPKQTQQPQGIPHALQAPQ